MRYISGYGLIKPKLPTTRWVLAVLTLLGLASLPFFVQAAPTGFQNEILYSGLTEPTGVTFTPDGRALVTERGGRIRLAQPGATQISSTPFLQLSNINIAGGERGLVGLTLDPNFTTNGYYYVFYTANSPLRDRVSRFTASGNTTNTTTEQVIWEDNVQAGDYHHGGTVAFGPDGYLYISTGEHFEPSNSQSLTSFRGKILRIASDGSIPATNPFNDGSGSNLDAIWARGLRNPFRFSFDSQTGTMYIGDVGGNSAASSIEEVNVGVPGANYGWPTCEGNCSNSGMTNPIFTYPHGGRDSSITGGFVYRGSQFPAEYVGTYFYGDYVRNWIKRLTFNTNGTVNQNVNFEPTDGANDGPFGEIVDLKEAPDGSVWYVDLGISWEQNVNQGTIRRISYASANQAPTAVATAMPTSGTAPLAVNFSSAGSLDPEGQTLSYSWDFGDGSTSTQANPSYTYQQTGNFTARLTVSDGSRTTLADPVSIVVGNRPATAISSPVSNTTFRAGDVINFSGTADDIEDDALPASAYTWTVLFHHDSHVHPAQGPTAGSTSGSYTIPASGHDFSGNTWYEIKLTARDSNNLESSSSVFIYPEKVNLTFNSSPSGRTITIDGINRTTPYVHDTLVGFQHIIAAPNQNSAADQYTFQSWSDSGAQSHGITVPVAAQTYGAVFQSVPVPSQLIGAYGFEENSGTTTADSSPSNNVGNLVSVSWQASGRFGSALTFNGTNSRVRSATNTSLGANFTMSAWVLNPSNAAYETIMTIGDNRDLYVNNGTLRFWDGGTDRTFGALPTGSWQHVALTYDGSSLRAYLNGTPLGSAVAVSGLGAVSAPWHIGSWINGSSNVDFFAGTLDEARLYNRAQSQADIQADMATPVMQPAADTTPPVISGGQPSGTLPASTTQTTLQVVTNENATCRYSTVAGASYASMTNAFTTTGGTGHSTVVTNLISDASYQYFVRCRDAATNTNPADYMINFSVAAADSQPPTVSLTAPAGSSTVSGTVTVSANAGDNVGVSGVQFLLDGSPLENEDTSAPYSITWNSAAASNGTHSLSARARDAAGNLTTSGAMSVTVNNALSGPMVAYSLNAGSGTAIADASGNNRPATATSATWTAANAGRFGRALTFNGTNSRARSNATMTLPANFTMSAWVLNPSNSAYETIMTLGSNRDLYLANGVINFWNGTTDTAFGTAITTNTWQHITITYNGSQLIAYVNGVQRGNAQNVSLGSVSASLQIGSWITASNTNADFLSGTIDEVRVYGRALTAAQILSDSNTAITP